MSKRHFIIVISLFLLAGAGWSIYGHYTAASKDMAAVAPAAGAQAAPVSVLKLETQTVAKSYALPGRVSAFRQSQVRPQVDGIITERLFEEGASVEKGRQLYQIDDARYKAALTSAEADLKSARSNIGAIEARMNRYEDLVKIDAVSHQELDDVKAQLDQAKASVAVAEAAVEVARVNLDYTKVYAPIDGKTGRTLVTEGALVTANQEQPLTVITQLDPVYVDMQQSGVDAMALQQARLEGQESIPVTVMLGDGNQVAYPHKGALKFSEVTIDETTGSITLRAVVPNPDGILLPGLFVRTVLDIGEEKALLVPQRAATRTPQGTLSVWVVGDDNTAQPRTVESAGAYKDNWIVSSGLKEGERIIIEGYQKIGPGAVVSPAPWKQAQDNLSDPSPVSTAQTGEQE